MNTATMQSKFERYVMGTYARFPIALMRGEGSWIWDVEGKKYLDFTSGIAVTSLGHCHPSIVKVIEEQAKKLLHSSNLFYFESQVELAELLVKNSFADKVFFCNTGTEATEAAIKLARKWGASNGKRYKIISAKGSFHGRTLGALSVTGQMKYREGFKPLVPGMKIIPYGKIGSMEKALSDEKVCAVMLEPIQGENGVVMPPEGYLKDVRELCDKAGVLLIFDEVQVGLGRTGRMFAYEHYGMEPDIMALAKALGGGIPAAAMLAREEVAIYFSPGSHGSTFGGNPLAMSAACEFVRTVLEDGILDNTQKMGAYFTDRLRELGDKHKKLVKDVRGKGLIIGVEFRSKEICKQIHSKCLSEGFVFIPTVEKVMRLLPPLNVTKEEIDFALKRISESLEELS